MNISPKVQNTQDSTHRHMKPKKKEDQNVDASVLLRRVSKIFTGGNMETKCGAETKERPPRDCPSWGSIPYTATLLMEA